MHFQTNTRLSFKKKKKKKTETLKPKTSFPIKIHTCSDYRFCSFKHTDRPCVAIRTLKPKSVLPTKIQTHPAYRFFAVPSNTDRRSKFILAQTTDSSLFLQTHRSALSCNKNPKTQIGFVDQNSDPLRPPILRCYG